MGRCYGQATIGQSTLTNLKKLCLFLGRCETCDLGEIEAEKVPILEYLCVQSCIISKKSLKYLSHLVKYWKLETLDISHSRGIKGKLSILMSEDLSSLRTLVLHDCDLNKEDMITLSMANKKGRLSKLENLDLSENYHLISCFGTDTGENCLTNSFGAVTSSWKSLKRLRIDYNPSPHEDQNGFGILNVLLKSGCIPAIEELRLTVGTGLSPINIGHWQHLKRLDIVGWTYGQCFFILDSLLVSLTWWKRVIFRL